MEDCNDADPLSYGIAMRHHLGVCDEIIQRNCTAQVIVTSKQIRNIVQDMRDCYETVETKRDTIYIGAFVRQEPLQIERTLDELQAYLSSIPEEMRGNIHELILKVIALEKVDLNVHADVFEKIHTPSRTLLEKARHFWETLQMVLRTWKTPHAIYEEQEVRNLHTIEYIAPYICRLRILAASLMQLNNHSSRF